MILNLPWSFKLQHCVQEKSIYPGVPKTQTATQLVPFDCQRSPKSARW
jgi:hypothetical protein